VADKGQERLGRDSEEKEGWRVEGECWHRRARSYHHLVF
jgi:hypothetical protein